MHRSLGKKNPCCTLVLGCAVLGLVTDTAAESSRPNILWLTVEDSSSYEFGCYGNEHVKTPAIDALAAAGVLYTNASSVAPQCSPARSTIISGAFATTYGTGFHRRKYESPPSRVFLPKLMRQAGYLCLNVTKRDYNTATPKRLWDPGDNYEAADGPFFAVYNNNASHMTSVRQSHLPASDVDISHLSHLPNLGEIRANYAAHLSAVEKIDRWVGESLSALEASGKQEDTIVFFFSDHGGCQPRGKAFPYETGLRVPFIVYVPEKWRHLCPEVTMGSQSDHLVGFEDLAPTVLSLIGQEAPPQMQGRAFLGHQSPDPKRYQFGFRTNQGAHYDPIRTASDGRFKYIRNYLPNKPLGMRQEYQWGMGANMAFDHANLKGELAPEHAAFFASKPPELLFDLSKDPYETKNLASSSEHQAVLQRLRAAVAANVRDTKDLGFFPPSCRRKRGTSLYEWVRNEDYPLSELFSLVEAVSESDPKHAPLFAEHLTSQYASLRFWAASGYTNIGHAGERLPLPMQLESLTSDSCRDTAAAAAEALCYHGQEATGVAALVEQIQLGSPPACSALEAYIKNRGVTDSVEASLPLLRQASVKRAKDSGGPPTFYVRSILVECGINTPWDLYDDSKWGPSTN